MILYNDYSDMSKVKWPEDYYAEVHPDDRWKILKYHIESRDGDPEECDILKRLYGLRYKEEKRGKETINCDLFMRAWLDMSMTSGSKLNGLNRKKLEEQWKGHLKSFGIQGFPCETELEKKLLTAEWRAFFEAYIRISRNDRRYGSKFLGLGRITPETMAKKLADELQRNTETFPEKIGMGEAFHEFHVIAEEVYRETKF